MSQLPHLTPGINPAMRSEEIINDACDRLAESINGDDVGSRTAPIARSGVTEWATGQECVTARHKLLELARRAAINRASHLISNSNDFSKARLTNLAVNNLRGGAWLLKVPLTVEAVTAVADSADLPVYVLNVLWQKDSRDLMVLFERLPALLSLALTPVAGASFASGTRGCPSLLAVLGGLTKVNEIFNGSPRLKPGDFNLKQHPKPRSEIPNV